MGDYIRSPLIKRYEYEDHNSFNFCQLNEKIFASRSPQKGVWKTLFSMCFFVASYKKKKLYFHLTERVLTAIIFVLLPFHKRAPYIISIFLLN